MTDLERVISTIVEAHNFEHHRLTALQDRVLQLELEISKLKVSEHE